MLVFFFIVLLFFLSHSLVKGFKDQLSKRFAWSYLGYWFVSLSVSLLNPFGLYPVSIETYMIMLLNVGAFIIGFSLVKVRTKDCCNPAIQPKLSEAIEGLCWNKYFWFCILFGIFVCYNNYNRYSAYLLLEDVDRVEAASRVMGLSSWQTFITVFFLPAFYEILLILVAYLLMYKRAKLLIVFFLVFLILYSLFGGGRQSFFNIFIAFYFLLFVSESVVHPSGLKISVPKWIYVVVVLLGLGSWVMMSWMTAARSGRNEWNMETFFYGSERLQVSFVTYSTLPFRLFDYGIHHENLYLDKIGGYQFGLSTLDGLNRYAYILLKRFGFSIDLVTEKTTALLQDTWVRTAPDRISNYAYTSAFYHYLDFGVFGVFLFSFLFGSFARLTIRTLYRNPSASAYCLLFYLFYVALHTVFTWHLNKPFSLGFIIVLSCFAFKKGRKRKKRVLGNAAYIT